MKHWWSDANGYQCQSHHSRRTSAALQASQLYTMFIQPHWVLFLFFLSAWPINKVWLLRWRRCAARRRPPKAALQPPPRHWKLAAVCPLSVSDKLCGRQRWHVACGPRALRGQRLPEAGRSGNNAMSLVGSPASLPSKSSACRRQWRRGGASLAKQQRGGE